MKMKESVPTMFLFFKDEKNSLGKLHLRFEDSLDLLNREGRTPIGNETYETLLNNKNFNLTAIIVNWDHPNLKEIMELKKITYPRVPVVFFYKKNAQNGLEKAKEDYKVKYEIEKGEVNKDRLNSLIRKITSDMNFNEKSNTEKRYEYLYNLGKGATSIVPLARYFWKVSCPNIS